MTDATDIADFLTEKASLIGATVSQQTMNAWRRRTKLFADEADDDTPSGKNNTKSS
jgi:hypothetical protein